MKMDNKELNLKLKEFTEFKSEFLDRVNKTQNYEEFIEEIEFIRKILNLPYKKNIKIGK